MVLYFVFCYYFFIIADTFIMVPSNKKEKKRKIPGSQVYFPMKIMKCIAMGNINL